MKPRIFNKVLPTVWPKAVMAGLALAPVAAAAPATMANAQTVVRQVNDAAAAVARLNQTILVNDQNGLDSGVLKDERDQMVLKLAELSGATTAVQSDGQYDVSIAGVSLVDGNRAGALAVSTGITATGAPPVPIAHLTVRARDGIHLVLTPRDQTTP